MTKCALIFVFGLAAMTRPPLASMICFALALAVFSATFFCALMADGRRSRRRYRMMAELAEVQRKEQEALREMQQQAGEEHPKFVGSCVVEKHAGALGAGLSGPCGDGARAGLGAGVLSPVEQAEAESDRETTSRVALPPD
jgi:hypothetical protein